MHTAINVLVGAALLGTAGGVMLAVPAERGPNALLSCRAVDGDTLRCDNERVRLLAIDAPEYDGHCRPGRRCVQGDPVASTESLEQAIVGPLKIERLGFDRYGRTLALVNGVRGDLSCWQLTHGQAVYKPQWDTGGRLAAICAVGG